MGPEAMLQGLQTAKGAGMDGAEQRAPAPLDGGGWEAACRRRRFRLLVFLCLQLLTASPQGRRLLAPTLQGASAGPGVGRAFGCSRTLLVDSDHFIYGVVATWAMQALALAAAISLLRPHGHVQSHEHF